MLGTSAFKPFESRGRRAVLAILLTFALCSRLSVGLSIWATSRSQNQASVVEVAARQRTLAERYLSDVLLAREGRTADPEYTAGLLARARGPCSRAAGRRRSTATTTRRRLPAPPAPRSAAS